MNVYRNILGNAYTEEWRHRLLGADIDYIELDQWNAQKSRLLAISTSGKAYPLAFERGERLHDGDIIQFDSQAHSAAVVKIKLGEVLVINIAPLALRHTEEALATAIELGHALGNQHWPAVVKGREIYVPLTVDRKVMLSVMRTHNFGGVEFAFRPGKEVLPYLSPSEVRVLFGGSLREHEQPHHSSAHPHHTHHSHTTFSTSPYEPFL